MRMIYGYQIFQVFYARMSAKFFSLNIVNYFKV